MNKKVCIVLSFFVWSTMGFALKPANLAMFGTGIMANFLTHELGHVVMGKATGGKITEFRWNRVGVEYDPDLSERVHAAKARKMLVGGYVVGTLASEVIVNTSDWHENDFALGWMAGAVGINFLNSASFLVGRRIDSDLVNYHYYGGNGYLLASLMLVHSVYSMYRIMNHSDIPIYFTQNTLGVRIKF